MFFRALVIAVSLVTTLASSGVLAQVPVAALAGLVSSPQSDAMEGVLVSASKTGSSDHGHSGDRQGWTLFLSGEQTGTRSIFFGSASGRL